MGVQHKGSTVSEEGGRVTVIIKANGTLGRNKESISVIIDGLCGNESM